MHVSSPTLRPASPSTSARPAAIDVTGTGSTLPPPDDVGTQIAMLIMQSAHQRRVLHEQLRNTMLALEDSKTAEQLEHMERAATFRLVAGITEGSLKLASAAASYVSVTQAAGARAAPLNSAAAQSQQLVAEKWNFAARGLDAGALTGASVARFMGDRAQEADQAAARAAAQLKRQAEQHEADARAADQAVEKAISFLNEWSEKQNLSRAAALYGR